MLSELIERLRKYRRSEIAEKSGVSIYTLNIIMSGANDNPTIKTVAALENFLKEKEQENESTSN